MAGHEGDTRVHVDAGLSDFVIGQFRVVAQHHVLRVGALRVHTDGFEHASHAFRADQPRLGDAVLLQPRQQVVGGEQHVVFGGFKTKGVEFGQVLRDRF